MILKKFVFFLCMLILFISISAVLFSPVFNHWGNRDASKYYLEEGPVETGASNVVSSIVWDFRGFDTLGEETVLFAAAVGVFTVIIFGFKIKERG